MYGLPIGLCQEGKSSPGALRRSAGTKSLASARVMASRRASLQGACLANSNASAAELKTLFQPLLEQTCGKLQSLSAGDPELLFALCRKLYKELSASPNSHRNNIVFGFPLAYKLKREDHQAAANRRLQERQWEVG
jgi:hypothetical protein